MSWAPTIEKSKALIAPSLLVVVVMMVMVMVVMVVVMMVMVVMVVMVVMRFHARRTHGTSAWFLQAS